MTTDINIINVNGLDYPIKDREARTIAESAVTMFAYYESGLVASQAYSKVGTLIFWKDALYETTATVAKGEIWEVGVNLSPSIKAGAILSELKDELTANGNRIYMDYQNGKYGYNTSPTRGADTFSPFNYVDVGTIQYIDAQLFTGYNDYGWEDTEGNGKTMVDKTYTIENDGVLISQVWGRHYNGACLSGARVYLNNELILGGVRNGLGYIYKNVKAGDVIRGWITASYYSNCGYAIHLVKSA